MNADELADGPDGAGLALALAAVTVAGTPAVPAAATASRTLEATFTTGIANGWVRVERWNDNGLGSAPEACPPDERGDQDGQRRTFFGNLAWPRSSRFLLYLAPGWDTGSKPTPVLLVHGANDNPDRAWANPDELGGFGCGATTCPGTGLMQYLSGRGYRVFAIGLSHKQGDNRYWAEQIHDAIEIIRSRTGAATVDYPFRHGWSHDFSIFPECGGTVNAPAPHTSLVCFGIWRDHPELSIFTTGAGNFFPGQGRCWPASTASSRCRPVSRTGRRPTTAARASSPRPGHPAGDRPGVAGRHHPGLANARLGPGPPAVRRRRRHPHHP